LSAGTAPAEQPPRSEAPPVPLEGQAVRAVLAVLPALMSPPLVPQLQSVLLLLLPLPLLLLPHV